MNIIFISKHRVSSPPRHLHCSTCTEL